MRVIEGWKPEEQFNHRIEFGQMWHACEEALAAGIGSRPGGWGADLREYCDDLCNRFPLSQEQIRHWEDVVRVTFPLYVEHWKAHPDVVTRTPLLQEKVFDVPYRLPSDRTVRLRGKWDAVDLVGKGKAAAVYLQENKTKGDIDPIALRRQLTFDLQTMLYVVALTEDWKNIGQVRSAMFGTGPGNAQVAGVRYNVIRRPLSGGKGSIVRHKPSKSNPAGESREAFYSRVAEYIKAEPDHFFMRWRVEVGPHDVARFRTECLDPILEAVCNWYAVVTNRPVTGHLQDCLVGYGHQWRHPFGCTNTIDEYGHSDLDEFLDTGSTVGLRRVETLFGELT